MGRCMEGGGSTVLRHASLHSPMSAGALGDMYRTKPLASTSYTSTWDRLITVPSRAWASLATTEFTQLCMTDTARRCRT